MRAGIEGTNSGLKRKMGLGRLRVRGKPRVFLSIIFKVAGWNILRASACTKVRELVLRKHQSRLFEGIMGIYLALKAFSATFTAIEEKLLHHGTENRVRGLAA